jgi:hypothetical protein
LRHFEREILLDRDALGVQFVNPIFGLDTKSLTTRLTENQQGCWRVLRRYTAGVASSPPRCDRVFERREPAAFLLDKITAAEAAPTTP